MSDIKYINIKDDRFWDILFDEAYVEGKQAERIQKELEQIAIDEKEINRKPMQEIVERLEEKAFIDYDEYYTDCGEMLVSFSDIIEIVKEVGGMNG